MALSKLSISAASLFVPDQIPATGSLGLLSVNLHFGDRYMGHDVILEHASKVFDLQLRVADIARRIPIPPPAAPDRHHIGYQELGLSFQHALSVVALTSTSDLNLVPSAFALVRPMYETLQRGWWFVLCATDDHASQLLDEDKFHAGQLTKIAADIDAQPPFVGTEFFSRLSQDEWNLYHSFTHGGRAALAMYGHRPALGAEFDPAVVLTMLDNAGRMSAIAAFGMCHVCGAYSPDEVRPLCQELVAMGPELGSPIPQGMEDAVTSSNQAAD